jgi:hypothetical protein
MKSTTPCLAIFTLILVGCNTLKETQVHVASGNYEQAIRNSIENLRKSRTKKKSAEYILILEEAFAKAVYRDNRNLERLRMDQSGTALEELFNTYQSLQSRQEYIMPLLPLYIADQGREAHFDIVNYNGSLLDSRNRLSEYLYRHATELLATKDKPQVRVAYENLNYLDEINPNYKETRNLIKEAHYLGTDFVLVKTVNASNAALPKRLENDLLDFEAYQLNGNQSWSVCRNNYIENIDYDYEMVLTIRDIVVSPERIYAKELIREKRIKDGFEYKLDKNGNVARDAQGNDIKVDKFVTSRSVVTEFTQSKSVAIEGKVEYRPFQGRENLSSFPLASEQIFKHYYCTHQGDRRALSHNDRGLLEHTIIPFPSNEQMIYETGEDLKNRLKQIIARNRF